MKQQKVIIISAFLIISVPMIMGSFYGLEFGYLALFCTALAAIFFNLHSFSSFEVFKIKAKLNETSDKTDKLNEFSILYVKDELQKLRTTTGLLPGRVVGQLNSLGHSDPYQFSHTLPSLYLDVMRIKKLIETLEIKDQEILKTLKTYQMEVAEDFQDNFELIIQSYLLPQETTVIEHSNLLSKFQEVRDVDSIFNSFKITRVFDFDKLDKLKQHLETLPGDITYLSITWQKSVNALNEILA